MQADLSDVGTLFAIVHFNFRATCLEKYLVGRVCRMHLSSCFSAINLPKSSQMISYHMASSSLYNQHF